MNCSEQLRLADIPTDVRTPEPVCTVVIASTAPCSTGSPITSALRYTVIGSYGHGGAYRAFT